MSGQRRFAGDAFNNMRPAGSLFPRNNIRPAPRQPQDPAWDLSWVATPAQEAAAAAEQSAWAGVRSGRNRAMRLNELHVIGDSTLPQLQEAAVQAYQYAVAQRAIQLQTSIGMPPLSAIATAMREIPAQQFAGGLPAEASFLRQYANASRVPSIRRMLDTEMDSHGEWEGLSPLQAIEEHRRQSMPPGSAAADDYIPF